MKIKNTAAMTDFHKKHAGKKYYSQHTEKEEEFESFSEHLLKAQNDIIELDRKRNGIKNT